MIGMDLVRGQIVKHEYGQDMVVVDTELLDDKVLCVFFEPIGGGLRKHAFPREQLHRTLPASTLRALLTILKLKL